ncbi:MAG TPA: PIG-L deacetylase family protein [Stellaceae bacterium]|nr:PIG-L deacetylase family protein [Methylovirgula sp.]HLI23068.1 PIG-L deacetylase family protein [Stellaceae bacterium]
MTMTIESKKFTLPSVADPQRAVMDASDVAIVVAHPDDESVGCGALLLRLRDAHLIVVTDGAPRNLADATLYGFEDAEHYRHRRATELADAMRLADVRSVTMLDVPDQETCRQLADVAQRLARFFAARRITTVLTHAYEGGHPDHDATAFCVHAAAALLGEEAPRIIEMPFYHLGERGMRVQAFCDGDEGTVLRLETGEECLKQRLLRCHKTQTRTLSAFSLEAERYRAAPTYNFVAPPNFGRVLYASFDWGLAPAEWPQLAHAAWQKLGMRGYACA